MAKSKNSRRKVTYIGASYLFTHTSVRDMLLNGNLENTDIVLYDIDKAALKLEFDVISKMIAQRNSSITIRAARTRREAIQNADYVVVSVLSGGLDPVEKEDRLCRKHGIRHVVGDTIGPMCTSRILRQAPLLVDIAKDMEKYAPGAIMLSPTNPMAALTTAINNYSKVNCIGVCHGTHFVLCSIAQAYKAKPIDVEVNLIGVNHFALVDRVRVKGKEIPVERVIKKLNQSPVKGYHDPATGEGEDADWSFSYAGLTGFIPNNSDHHFLEFVPWFLAPHAFDKKGKCKYKNVAESLLDVKKRKKNKIRIRKILEKWAYGKDPIPDMDCFGADYIHDIILGLEGNVKAMNLKEMHLNVLNNGSVPNLPDNAALELTMEISKNKFAPVKNPPLDDYRWGRLSRIVAINQLAVKAAMEKDKRAFIQALLLDPLLYNFDSVEKLADELWNINKPWFKPKK